MRLRIYLQQKYHIQKAYYFIGCYQPQHKDIYQMLKDTGYLLVFREHQKKSESRKKGNVDTDIVFLIMKKLYLREKLYSIFLISGDGDYFRMVKFLCEEGKMGKVLFPARQNASSLYRRIPLKYRDSLDTEDIKKKIAYKK